MVPLSKDLGKIPIGFTEGILPDEEKCVGDEWMEYGDDEEEEIQTDRKE